MDGTITKMKMPAFDIIGDVAVVEIPEDGNEKEIVRLIIEKHPHVMTILKKAGQREGEYRTRKLKRIYGKETSIEYKEHGCRFRLDVVKTYFSPRETTERQRIAEQVKSKETVMVFFSGIGPFNIVIAKKKPDVDKVYGIESNPDAHKYAMENARINKVGHKFVPIMGDVKEAAKKYFGKCDRVVMPLPKEGYKYLPEALKCTRKGTGGTVHFYFYEHEDQLFKESVQLVKEAVKKMNKRVRILNKRKVLPYGPRVWKVCIEFRVRG
jgi:tRNA (guanine37-N1)-methyltransferase